MIFQPKICIGYENIEYLHTFADQRIFYSRWHFSHNDFSFVDFYFFSQWFIFFSHNDFSVSLTTISLFLSQWFLFFSHNDFSFSLTIISLFLSQWFLFFSHNYFRFPTFKSPHTPIPSSLEANLITGWTKNIPSMRFPLWFLYFNSKLFLFSN